LVKVLTPDFSVAANPTTINISAPGQTGTTVITTTALYNFSGTVSFQCPDFLTIPKATCAVSPPSVTTSTSGTTTVTITTTAPSTTYPLFRPNWFGTGTGVVVVGVLLLLLSTTSKRRLKLAYGVLLAGSLAAFLLACGGGGGGGRRFTNPGTPPGNYTVGVTATSGNLTHTINVNVNVQ